MRRRFQIPPQGRLCQDISVAKLSAPPQITGKSILNFGWNTDRFIDDVHVCWGVKKTATIGIIAAVAVAAVVASLYIHTETGPQVPTQQGAAPIQNATVPTLQGNASTASPVHNATGRHLSVTIQEQVGIKSK